MATTVYSKKDITLQDGTDVVLMPLPIERLRRFMEAWEKFASIENDSEGFGVFINCCGIALETNYKGKFESLKASATEKEKGEFLSPEYKDYLENTLDLDSIYEILDVTGGLKLNDPKLMEAVQKAQAQAAAAMIEGGTD